MGKRELFGRKVTTRALAPPPPPPLPLHKSSERETALKVQLVNGKVMTWGGGGYRKRRGNSPSPASHLMVVLGHLVPSALPRAQGSLFADHSWQPFLGQRRRLSVSCRIPGRGGPL